MASQTLAASKRLRKELQVLRKSQNEKDDDIFLQNNPDNLLVWKAWIRGPCDTPYEGGVFQLDIRCGMDYPLSPPTIKFVTKVRIGWMDVMATIMVPCVLTAANFSTIFIFDRFSIPMFTFEQETFAWIF